MIPSHVYFVAQGAKPMRKATLSVLAVVIALGSMAAVWAAEPTASGKLRHVVMFKFKDGTAAEDIKKVENAFRELPKKIPAIVGFEWGTNNSPENLAQGFTHCFLLTFNDAQARDAYLPHPAHKAFGKLLGPHLDKVLVIDFFGQP
jgi:hypothetical protein